MREMNAIIAPTFEPLASSWHPVPRSESLNHNLSHTGSYRGQLDPIPGIPLFRSSILSQILLSIEGAAAEAQSLLEFAGDRALHESSP